MAKTMSKWSTGERLGWVQRRQHSGLLGFGRRLDRGQSGRCEPGELVERGRRRQPHGLARSLGLGIDVVLRVRDQVDRVLLHRRDLRR